MAQTTGQTRFARVCRTTGKDFSKDWASCLRVSQRDWAGEVGLKVYFVLLAVAAPCPAHGGVLPFGVEHPPYFLRRSKVSYALIVGALPALGFCVSVNQWVNYLSKPLPLVVEQKKVLPE